MALKKVGKFEGFLSESFEDDIFVRELRLSDEEVEYVKEKYPRALLKKCQTDQNSDGKAWYEINLLSPIDDREESLNSQDIADIKEENIRLKKELERVKKTVLVPASK